MNAHTGTHKLTEVTIIGGFVVVVQIPGEGRPQAVQGLGGTGLWKKGKTTTGTIYCIMLCCNLINIVKTCNKSLIGRIDGCGIKTFFS